MTDSPPPNSITELKPAQPGRDTGEMRAPVGQNSSAVRRQSLCHPPVIHGKCRFALISRTFFELKKKRYLTGGLCGWRRQRLLDLRSPVPPTKNLCQRLLVQSTRICCDCCCALLS